MFSLFELKLKLKSKICREVGEDGKELTFDHEAPFFSVTNPNAISLVHEWESLGFVSQWKQVFGSFDSASNMFLGFQQVFLSIYDSLSILDTNSNVCVVYGLGRGSHQQQQVCGCSRHELYIKDLVQPLRYVSLFFCCYVWSLLV